MNQLKKNIGPGWKCRKSISTPVINELKRNNPQERGLIDLIGKNNKIKKIEEKPQDKIVDVYVDDYDIIHTDSIIRRWFEYKKKEGAADIKKQIKKIENEYAPTIIDQKIRDKKIKELNEENELYMNNYLYTNYSTEVDNILNEYRELSSFDCDNLKPKKLYLINEFCKIASRYYDITLVRIYPKQRVCTDCNSKIENSSYENNGILICECGLVIPQLIPTIYDYDYSSGITIISNDYEDRVNFRKAMLKFQGEQTNNIPEKLYKDLDEYFESQQTKLGDEIKLLESNEYGEKPGTSIKLMCIALKKTGNSYYYGDINLICHEYWGWNLIKITNEEKIMSDYDEFMSVFNQEKGFDRNSSLGTQYMLCFLLIKNDYKVTRHQFKMISTVGIIDYYESMRRKCCEILGWEYFAIF